jgi:hypothetical protein
MSWTESDHARLVALKQQRAELRRVPDEELDKEKVRKLTIEIKAINKRLVAHQKGLVTEPEPVEEETVTEPEPVEEETDLGLPEGVLEAYNAWQDKTGKWTDFVKASSGVAKAKEYRAVIEN